MDGGSWWSASAPVIPVMCFKFKFKLNVKHPGMGASPSQCEPILMNHLRNGSTTSFFDGSCDADKLSLSGEAVLSIVDCGGIGVVQISFEEATSDGESPSTPDSPPPFFCSSTSHPSESPTSIGFDISVESSGGVG